MDSLSLLTTCLSFGFVEIFYQYVGDCRKSEEDIGFYAGYVGSSYMLGRALTSVFWGMVADRSGRKPVIIIGTTAVVVFNTLFGLSVNYWMPIVTKFLLGSLNGLLGPIKAYASEVFREEHQALGMSPVSTTWGIGLIIGPALGGFFAQALVNSLEEKIDETEKKYVEANKISEERLKQALDAE